MARKLFSEWLGTLFLLATVVGSGIMAESLSNGNIALALLCNTLPTGAILVVLILIFGPISGAHFNPAVTLVFAIRKEIGASDSIKYILAQITGGIVGIMIAHFMFEMPLIDFSVKARSGPGQFMGEFVATFGLIATILGCLKARAEAVPYAVGLYITAAYWFTSSTSFANPAVTIARSFSDSFAGISPAHVPLFIFAQIFAALMAAWVFKWLLSDQNGYAS